MPREKSAAPEPARMDAASEESSPPPDVTPPQSRALTRLEAVSAEFAGLYDAHCRPVFYLCLRMLGDPSKAEDATHDVFLRAWRSLDKFRGDSSFRTWFYRIAINHCRNVRQSWAERHLLPTEDAAVLESGGREADSPLRVMELRELGERIQRTLAALPPEHRLLLLLVADSELSYDEIADLTGQSTDAVRGKLHRARKAFAREFPKTA